MIETLLSAYRKKGLFTFRPTDSLKIVCNAPTNCSGIYLVYGFQKGRKTLIYIGISGKLEADGTMFIRKAGLGGIKDRIVNGHQFGKIPRKKSWPAQMSLDKIDSLEVHWFITHDNKVNDCPRVIENRLLQSFLDSGRQLPMWNEVT